MMDYLQDLLLGFYPWTLVLHLVSVISWMAGLFYLPRLFVYHVEKADISPELDPVFQEMERKLLRAIMNPAMISSWIFGLMLVFTRGLWTGTASGHGSRLRRLSG